MKNTGCQLSLRQGFGETGRKHDSFYYANAMSKKTFFFSTLLFFLLIPVATSWGAAVSSGPFAPLPLENKYDAKIAALGKKLFYDSRLSKDNQMTCNSCHNNQLNGIDARPKAVGPDNMISKYNTSSLYNATLSYKLFWDGRERLLNRAIRSHIENPTIMAGKWPDILALLSNDAALSSDFSHLFKDGLTSENVISSLADYLASQRYSPSRFDTYLRGDLNAITVEEKRGLKKFMDLGCSLCHQGKLLGGNPLITLGIIYPYPDNPTKKKYKVASLRNVTKTAPYFHDGSISTLEDAIKIMAKYQLGVNIKDDEVSSIVLFLKTLESTLTTGAENAP